MLIATWTHFFPPSHLLYQHAHLRGTETEAHRTSGTCLKSYLLLAEPGFKLRPSTFSGAGERALDGISVGTIWVLMEKQGQCKSKGKWAGSTKKAQTAAREALPWKPRSMTASQASRRTRCAEASKVQIQGPVAPEWVILRTKGCLFYDTVPLITSVSYRWKISFGNYSRGDTHCSQLKGPNSSFRIIAKEKNYC